MNKQYISGYGQISNLGLNTDLALKKLLDPSPSDVISLPCDHLKYDNFVEHLLEIPGLEKIQSRSDFTYNRTNQMLCLCVNEALDRAGITPKHLKDNRVGVCIGTTSANLTCVVDFGKAFYREEAEDFTPLSESFRNNPSSSIATYYGLDGPLASINNACTSGTDAIGIATSWLKQDLCDIVIAGGIDSVLEDIYAGFRSLGLISTQSPKPFDKNRDGLVLGEAVGILVVESEKSTVKRKARRYCEVLGYGLATDSFHPTTPHPEAKGLALAVDQALKVGNLKAKDIDLINAHGTGTETNDKIEGQYFVNQFKNTPVFGTKAYTGHTLGAAGTLEAIWGVLALNEAFIPATLGFEEMDPEINLTPNLEVKEYNANIYLSTSLGFGGSNSALLLGKTNE